MEPELNPYSPGSGRKPQVLVGRDAEILAFDTVVARRRTRRGDRGIVMTGLRGVGKTVLLNELFNHAVRFEWLTVRLEARRDEAGAAAVRRTLARELVVAARSLRRRVVSEQLTEALRTITSFNLSVGATGVSLGVEAAHGRADSGDPEVDLLELVEDVCAALPSGRGFAIFIDEMQDVDSATLGALIAAQHVANQRDWPFYIVAAGLPNLPRVLTDARSYAERLFNYRQIGQLAPADAAEALSKPAEQLGARFTRGALEILLDAAGGYPYFLQEYGQAVWNLASPSTIHVKDAEAAVEFGLEHLDAGFFQSRWERATPAERRFLRAMAEDESFSQIGLVAERLDSKVSSLGPARAKLMAKGLIFSPQHGQLAYTVPGMAGYIHRHHRDSQDDEMVR